ncbi:hypothetical protein [Halomicrococcus sp. SG-WS-1]|uniref:hypothetical protein n=1 Tax=Halomicrococcus sp. SG-WS-1 TaxID=3439057 RepID=UPI003F793242
MRAGPAGERSSNQVVKNIREKQDRNNPYNKQTQPKLYNKFKENWYIGYGSYYVLSMVTGQQATKAAKNSKTLSKIVDKLDRNGKLTKVSRYLDAAESRTTGAAKKYIRVAR